MNLTKKPILSVNPGRYSDGRQGIPFLSYYISDGKGNSYSFAIETETPEHLRSLADDLEKWQTAYMEAVAAGAEPDHAEEVS